MFSYSVILFAFLIFSYAFVDYNFLYLKNFYTGFSVTNREITTFIYIGFILILFVFYFLFLSLARQKKLNMNHLRQLVGISLVTLFFSYPAMLSYDIFNYTTTAKTLFFYRENPYIIMPIEFTSDPFLLYTHAANKIALYGPVWILLTGFPYFFSFGNFLLNILIVKFLIGAFYLGMVFLIWRISRNIFSVVLFALNPLVIVETLGSGHNDVAMMFFALFSFWLIFKKRITLAVAFLILSIGIKYATIFLIPAFFYAVYSLLKKNKLGQEKVFFLSFISMSTIFFLSPLREEMYPWYAIWLLTFVSLNPARKFILYTTIVFSFGLLLRYTPYMFTGTYLGLTPVVKTIVSFTPPILFSIYHGIKKKV